MAGETMPIYKILRAAEWREFQKVAIFQGSADDLRDGFIHLSTAEQVPGTAAKHFTMMNDLFIIAVDPARLGAGLRWEESRGGALFPHLYAPLTLDAVVWAEPLPLGGEAHVFPEAMR